MFIRLLRIKNSGGLLCIFFLLLRGSLFSQKQDYVWLSGYGSELREDTGWNSIFGNNRIEFNDSNVTISYDSLGMGFTATNVSYCNQHGNLLFYSNGIYVANALDEKIENSDSLNPGYFQYKFDPSMQQVGYSIYNGLLALEHPGRENLFYLIHSFVDTIDENYTLACKNILLSVLDMNDNAGHGKVISKNDIVLHGRFGFELKATRHANGRDWWILVQKRNTNCYERLLLNNTGLHVLPAVCAGTNVNGFAGSASFSQDGSKYVYLSLQGHLNLFDFDRCSGELSNPQYKYIPIFTDTGLIAIGTAFSPNSRFLYVNAQIHCYQFDLWANDIWASTDTVARFDGSANPFASIFHTMQIAPNGKIYSACGNGEYVYHVIDRPDEKGDSCHFMQHAVVLPATTGGGLPNFPNYRLGALTGSGCDTLTHVGLLSEEEAQIKVYPNPSNEFVVVDYGFIDWGKGEATMYITNEAGQQVYEQKLPMYSGFRKIDVSEFTSGVYTAYLKRDNRVIVSRQFVKQ